MPPETSEVSGHWMSGDEFSRLCQSIFGRRYKAPASRALASTMITPYSRGDNFVPPDIARRLRNLAEMGPAEKLIKKAILTRLSERRVEGPQERAHFLAKEIVDHLKRAGLL